MKSFAAVVALLTVVAAVVPFSQAGKSLSFPHPLISGKEIHLDVEAMMHDPKIVGGELSCLLENKNCSPITHALVKQSLKEGLYYNCRSCTAVQKEAHDIIMPILERDYPEKLNQVRQKYAYLKN